MKIQFVFTFFMVMIFSVKAQISEVPAGWMLHTNSMTYYLSVYENQLYTFYYGPRVLEADYSNNNLALVVEPEIPVRGNAVREIPVVEAVFADGVRDIELLYVSSELLLDNNYPVLRVIQKDRFYPLQIISCYRVLPEYDIIEKWIEIAHTGNDRDEDILLENMQSGTLWLPAANYELTHFSGSLRNEFQPQVTLLTTGVKSLRCKDFKSYGAPFFAVRPSGEYTEDSGEVWYGQLPYRGNWNIDLEKSGKGGVQITAGIFFWDTSVNMAPGDVFKTPVFSFGYTRRGYEGVAQNYAAYASEVLAPEIHRKNIRPVIYNSWYATEFDLNQEQQLALAKVAKDIGVELFVIDDGWFKGRTSENGGLGDWVADKNKFPQGLTPLIEEINNMGMDFGIWVEPEMVSPDSDLYRDHPDWIFHYPNRQKTLGRGQYMLNLGREDVFQYLLRVLTDLLQDHKIKYVKWDMNRHLSEPGWPSAAPNKQREARIRHIGNLYRLVDTLKEKFPHVLFETCSSGGGRVDLGILSRMDMAWASDNIDPLDRVFIQYAYQHVFPTNTMISWTGQEDWHAGNYSLEFRFDVAMNGVLGIGNDITQWGEKEKAVAKEKIALYKEIRPVVQNGVLYKLMSPFESNHSVLEFVSRDKSEAVVFCYNTSEQLSGGTRYPIRDLWLKLKGLKPEAMYIIEGMQQTFSGNYLMKTGLKYNLKGVYNSQIIQIKQLESGL